MVLQTVLSLVYSGVTMIALLMALIWSLTHIPALKARIKPALVVAGVVLLLGLPMQALSLYHLDFTAALGEIELPAETMALMQTVMWIVGPLTVATTMVFSLFAMVLQFSAADGAEEQSGFPFLTRQPGAREGWGLAIGAGAVLGIVSTVVFGLLDIGMSSMLEQQMAMMPGLDLEAPLVVLLAITPATLAAAISEEVVFRGLIQRWLTKWLGGSGNAAVVAVVLSSGVWAIGHAANTDAVVFKLSQIFLFGLLLGWMTRRYSVETSIVAHLSLNFFVCTSWLALNQAGIL